MALDAKIENILGKLEIIVPSLDDTKEKVERLTTQSAVFDMRLTSVEKKLCDMTPSGNEKRSRVWDIVLLVATMVLTNLVTFFGAIKTLKFATKAVTP